MGELRVSRKILRSEIWEWQSIEDLETLTLDSRDKKADDSWRYVIVKCAFWNFFAFHFNFISMYRIICYCYYYYSRPILTSC